MSTADVAVMTTLSASQIRKLARQGEIPSARFGPRLLRFKRSEIQAWMNDRLVANS